MGDDYFTSNEVSVAVGTTVVWQIDAGEAQHDVMAIGGSFASISPMARGLPFSYTFSKAGEYAYVCTFHVAQGMTGKVIVR